MAQYYTRVVVTIKGNKFERVQEIAYKYYSLPADISKDEDLIVSRFIEEVSKIAESKKEQNEVI